MQQKAKRLKPISMPVQKGGGCLDVRGLFGFDDGNPFVKVTVQHADGWYVTEKSFGFILRSAQDGKEFHSGPPTVVTHVNPYGRISLTVTPPSGEAVFLDADTVKEIIMRLHQVVAVIDTYDLEAMRDPNATDDEPQDSTSESEATASWPPVEYCDLIIEEDVPADEDAPDGVDGADI